MKKMCIYLIAVIFSLACSNCIVGTLASENAEEKAVMDVLLEQADTEEKASLYDRGLYNEKMQEYDLTNKPVVTIYNSCYWDLFADTENTLEEITTIAQQANAIDYVVFDEEIIRVRKNIYNGKTTIGINKKYDILPQYLMDMRDASAIHQVTEQNHNIINVICFDGSTSYQGIIVYYVTDNGDYIKYYEDNDSPGVEFGVTEFRNYALQYYLERTAYSNNYSENGEPLSGVPSFLDIVNTSIEQIDSNSKDSESLWNKYIWILPCVMVAIGAGCFVVWRMKRKG